ncbi:hypothetical protein N9C48_00920 [bacterium]|jgi:hypothetical protein|nr:hypothetical protein [bacterium]
MFNPLVDDFSLLKDSEVEEKLFDLKRKYWQTRNPSVQEQISVIMNMYAEEMHVRSAKAMQKTNDDSEKGLDNLINIS